MPTGYVAIMVRNPLQSVTLQMLIIRQLMATGFNEEFVYSDAELQLIDKYADVTDELHTDLHECLGHGSGKLLPGVDPDA